MSAGAVSAVAEAPVRCADRMKVRLADALWSCLEEKRLADISVGDVIEAADVSRGSFYYHFSDLDHLTAWALACEIMDSDTGRVTLLRSSLRARWCQRKRPS